QTTTAPVNAGEYTVTATDTDPNFDGIKSLDFAISKATQTITFSSIPVKYLDEGTFTLNATASSGLAVSYTSSNTNVATVSGSTVTLRSAGTTTITASQSGDSNWNAAESKQQPLTVQARDTDGDGVTDVMELADGTAVNNASQYNNLSKGLIAFYPFDGNANDVSGYSNHATPQGNTQFLNNGLSGGSLRITGDFSLYYSGGGWVQLPLFNSNLNAGFTFSLWAKDEDMGGYPVNQEEYISFGELNHTLASIGLTDNGNYVIWKDLSSGSQPGVTSKAVGDDRSWKNFTLTYTPGTLTLYRNGSVIWSTNTTKDIFPVQFAALGKHWWDNGGSSSARMSCTYENVRIYERALNAQEVGQLYSTELGKPFVDFVTIGNPGNAGDTLVMEDGTTGYGDVSYQYKIGKYEITTAQYCAFLNSVAKTDPYGLYLDAMSTDQYSRTVVRSGVLGSYTYRPIGGYESHPIAYVTWFNAARYCNWLHNGGTNGASTETGAYLLNGATNGLNFFAQPGAKFRLPTEDEWYKAAYYDPAKNSGLGGYWLYPNRSDSISTGGANFLWSYGDGNGIRTTPVGRFVNTVSY
ncbi:MAG: hypothetical protein EBS53_15465, partial [Bacteroidetes bacterium]|nr:hypothetical protein [Bacteroidota bacterium]